MRGHTLIELLFVLTLATVGASAFVSSARKLRDRLVASAAREMLVAGFADARAISVRSGGATLTIRGSSPAYRIDTAQRTGTWAPLDDPLLRLRLDAGRDSIKVEFDRMGLVLRVIRSRCRPVTRHVA